MSTDGTAEGEESLVEIIRRTPILALLAHDGPQERPVLEKRLGISRSTSHRLTRTLGDMTLIQVRDKKVGLTPTGEKVAELAEWFTHNVIKELVLAPVHEALQGFEPTFPEAVLREATVTDAEAGDPFHPVRRFNELIENTKTLRGIDIAAIAPLYMEEALSRILGGMQTDDIGVPETARYILRNYPDKCHDACASGNLRTHLIGSAPFALLILEDHMALGVRSPGSRQLRVLVDSDDPRAVAWAEQVYDDYKTQAVSLPQFSTPAFHEALATLQKQAQAPA